MLQQKKRITTLLFLPVIWSDNWSEVAYFAGGRSVSRQLPLGDQLNHVFWQWLSLREHGNSFGAALPVVPSHTHVYFSCACIIYRWLFPPHKAYLRIAVWLSRQQGQYSVTCGSCHWHTPRVPGLSVLTYVPFRCFVVLAAGIGGTLCTILCCTYIYIIRLIILKLTASAPDVESLCFIQNTVCCATMIWLSHIWL